MPAQMQIHSDNWQRDLASRVGNEAQANASMGARSEVTGGADAMWASSVRGERAEPAPNHQTRECAPSFQDLSYGQDFQEGCAQGAGIQEAGAQVNCAQGDYWPGVGPSESWNGAGDSTMSGTWGGSWNDTWDGAEINDEMAFMPEAFEAETQERALQEQAALEWCEQNYPPDVLAQIADDNSAQHVPELIRAVLCNNGLFAREYAYYRPRIGQVVMAQLVGEALQQAQVELIEAGTGVGKTYAYLLPLILSKQSVLVSTHTKILQEQLVKQDLPQLLKLLHLEEQLSFASVKGMNNYLCHFKLDMLRPDLIAEHYKKYWSNILEKAKDEGAAKSVERIEKRLEGVAQDAQNRHTKLMNEMGDDAALLSSMLAKIKEHLLAQPNLQLLSTQTVNHLPLPLGEIDFVVDDCSSSVLFAEPLSFSEQEIACFKRNQPLIRKLFGCDPNSCQYCMFFQQNNKDFVCFYYQAYDTACKSNIVVINHALLLTKVIPRRTVWKRLYSPKRNEASAMEQPSSVQTAPAVQTAQSVQTSQSLQSANPVQTVNSAQTTQTAQPVQLAESTQSAAKIYAPARAQVIDGIQATGNAQALKEGQSGALLARTSTFVPFAPASSVTLVPSAPIPPVSDSASNSHSGAVAHPVSVSNPSFDSYSVSDSVPVFAQPLAQPLSQAQAQVKALAQVEQESKVADQVWSPLRKDVACSLGQASTRGWQEKSYLTNQAQTPRQMVVHALNPGHSLHFESKSALSAGQTDLSVSSDNGQVYSEKAFVGQAKMAVSAAPTANYGANLADAADVSNNVANSTSNNATDNTAYKVADKNANHAALADHTANQDAQEEAGTVSGVICEPGDDRWQGSQTTNHLTADIRASETTKKVTPALQAYSQAYSGAKSIYGVSEMNSAGVSGSEKWNVREIRAGTNQAYGAAQLTSQAQGVGADAAWLAFATKTIAKLQVAGGHLSKGIDLALEDGVKVGAEAWSKGKESADAAVGGDVAEPVTGWDAVAEMTAGNGLCVGAGAEVMEIAANVVADDDMYADEAENAEATDENEDDDDKANDVVDALLAGRTALVCDEAHELERCLVNIYQNEISSTLLNNFISDINRLHIRDLYGIVGSLRQLLQRFVQIFMVLPEQSYDFREVFYLLKNGQTFLQGFYELRDLPMPPWHGTHNLHPAAYQRDNQGNLIPNPDFKMFLEELSASLACFGHACTGANRGKKIQDLSATAFNLSAIMQELAALDDRTRPIQWVVTVDVFITQPQTAEQNVKSESKGETAVMPGLVQSATAPGGNAENSIAAGSGLGSGFGGDLGSGDGANAGTGGRSSVPGNYGRKLGSLEYSAAYGMTFREFRERFGNVQKSFVLRMVPVSVANIGREVWSILLNHKCVPIMTSATLRLLDVFGQNSFRGFKQRLGLHELPVTQAVVPSPFDYRRHTRVWLSHYFQSSQNARTFKPEHQAIFANLQRIKPLIDELQGGILILVTSFQMIADYIECLKQLCPQRYLFAQTRGEDLNKVVASFKQVQAQGKPAILVGTSSCWTGLNLVGSMVRMVVIDKAPFEPFDMRQEIMRDLYNQGREWAFFQEVYLPNMLLKLKQGIGRLIRSEQDWGIVVPMFKMPTSYALQVQRTFRPMQIIETEQVEPLLEFLRDQKV